MDKRIKMNKKVLWITQTGLFIALLVVLQWSIGAATSAMPPPFNTLIVGSIVNAILIISVMTCGFASGIAVACLSNVTAFFFGIGVAFPVMIPFVCLGNITIVMIWYFVTHRAAGGGFLRYILALVLGAAGKFAVLYIGIVMIVAPHILNLPAAAPVYMAFSYPQLITATIGGAVAIAILPILKKALKDS